MSSVSALFVPQISALLASKRLTSPLAMKIKSCRPEKRCGRQEWTSGSAPFAACLLLKMQVANMSLVGSVTKTGSSAVKLKGHLS